MTMLFGFLVCLSQFVVFPSFASPDRGAKLVFIGIWGLVFFLLQLKRTFCISAVHLSGVAFAFLLLLSSAYSLAPTESMRMSLAFLPFLLLVVLATQQAEKDTYFLNNLALPVLLFGLIAALLGLYEYLSFYLLGPCREMLIPFLLPSNASLRVGGMYGQPNLFALFLTLVLICYFYVYIHGRNEKRGGISALRFLPVVMIATIFFLTGSRAGLLGVSSFISLSLWLVYKKAYLTKAVKEKYEYFKLLASLFVGFVIASSMPSLLSLIVDGTAATSLLRFGSGEGDSRLILWASSFLIFLDHPGLGAGLDSFKLLLAPYQVKAHDFLGFVEYDAFGYGFWSHNEVLQLMAELGVGGLLFVLLLFGYLFRYFLAKFREGFEGPNVASLYCMFLLLPFFVQTLFSWPLRHPGLLAMFSVILGCLARDSIVRNFIPSRFVRGTLIILVTGVLVVFTAYGHHEFRMGQLFATMESEVNPFDSLRDFHKYAVQPFSEFRVLVRGVPLLVNYALDEHNKELVIAVLPYANRLVELQGAFWQWYYLAKLYHELGESNLASNAVQKVIDLQPVYQPAWELQHRLHAEEAARKTGLPLEHFLPEQYFGVDKSDIGDT